MDCQKKKCKITIAHGILVHEKHQHFYQFHLMRLTNILRKSLAKIEFVTFSFMSKSEVLKQFEMLKYFELRRINSGSISLRYNSYPHPKNRDMMTAICVISLTVFFTTGSLKRRDVKSTFLSTHRATSHPSPVHANVKTKRCTSSNI